MDDSLHSTLFAPAVRARADETERQNAVLRDNKLLHHVIDGMPEPVMVLNRERQIVLANARLATMLGRSPDALVGMRPGEAFGCVHAKERPAGCGTTEACRYCGAVNAIVDSQSADTLVALECRIRQCDDGALDLLIWANPLEMAGEHFTVVAVRDTTHQHRREVLERIFFHDLLNTAGGIKGILDLLPELDEQEAAEFGDSARHLATQLVEEIQMQRALAAAESGDLSILSAAVDAAALLAKLHALYQPLATNGGRRLPPPVIHGDTRIVTDELLLARALGNLIKNALEASVSGQTVTISFETMEQPVFRVHNETSMPAPVRAQIFQRSFTTKGGAGHGLGTYSAKLLVERYLRGTVTFTTSAADGTTFVVTLPPT